VAGEVTARRKPLVLDKDSYKKMEDHTVQDIGAVTPL
jgi:hypothetical protein